MKHLVDRVKLGQMFFYPGAANDKSGILINIAFFLINLKNTLIADTFRASEDFFRSL